MTPAELLAAFDVLADAPDGVKRLRELVLSLAVRGKLVEQRDAISDNSGRRVDPPVSPDSEPFGIPPRWHWARLQDLGQYNGRPNVGAEAIPSDGWLLDLEDIEKVSSRLLRRTTAADRVPKGTRSTFHRGDVLYGKLRPYLDKVIVADGPGYCTTEIVPIVPFDDVDPAWIRLCLKRPDFVHLVTSLSYGVKMPRLGTADATSSLHPLPPLAEQHRIVARVDELMALLDKLEAARAGRDEVRRAARDAALAALRDAPDAEAVEVAWGRVSDAMDELFVEPEDVEPLRQAVLGLAVRGRLVPTRPGAAVTAGPCPIPTGWAWKSLLDLTSMITSGSRNWNQFYSATGATFIRSQDIKHDRLEYDDRAYVTVPGGSEGTRTRVDQGDWLITITGANVGKCALLRDHPGEAYVSQHVALMRPKNRDFGRFGHIWLTAEQGGRGVLLADSYGAKPGLNLHQLRSLPVPVPPSDERDRIVAKVDALMIVCDALAARLRAARDLHGQFAGAAVHHFEA